MKTKPNNVEEYLSLLPEPRRLALGFLRQTILENLPDGFAEVISYGMPCYVVPHTVYPAGYHCNPSEPLPFIGFASQKNYISFYHMGLYADHKLSDWFMKEYSKHSNARLDMGKSCIRFKNPEKIPYRLIGELVKKMTASQWIAVYENQIKK